jgi:hypothetical protein
MSEMTEEELVYCTRLKCNDPTLVDVTIGNINSDKARCFGEALQHNTQVSHLTFCRAESGALSYDGDYAILQHFMTTSKSLQRVTLRFEKDVVLVDRLSRTIKRNPSITQVTLRIDAENVSSYFASEIISSKPRSSKLSEIVIKNHITSNEISTLLDPFERRSTLELLTIESPLEFSRKYIESLLDHIPRLRGLRGLRFRFSVLNPNYHPNFDAELMQALYQNLSLETVIVDDSYCDYPDFQRLKDLWCSRNKSIHAWTRVEDAVPVSTSYWPMIFASTQDCEHKLDVRYRGLMSMGEIRGEISREKPGRKEGYYYTRKRRRLVQKESTIEGKKWEFQFYCQPSNGDT